MNNNKLFVGGLAWATTDESLRAHFADVGEVLSAQVVMDRMTGRSRGFGFVEMGNADLAQEAIKAKDQSELDGRNINVSLAQPPKPREDRPRRDFGGGRDNRGGGDRGGFRRDNRGGGGRNFH